MKRGLLLSLTEPPAAMEKQFNAWYDDEHLPEPLAIPGFRSARRWVCGRTCLGTLVAFKPWACEQIEPGDADPHPAPRGQAFSFEPLTLSGVLQRRLFAAESGEKIALYELSDLQQPSAIFYRLYKS